MFQAIVMWSFVLMLGAGLKAPLNALEGENGTKAAIMVTQMMTAARPVIAKWQLILNDPDMGDKGFTKDVFAAEASKAMKEQFGIDTADPNLPPEAKAMWDAMLAVIDAAQPVINKSGLGFKGFLPAVFARQAGAKWATKVPGAYAKLTTVHPAHNPVNKPDDWEKNVLMQFRANPDYNNRGPVSEITTFKGKKAVRIIQPEYMIKSCLACHGAPKGEPMPGKPSAGIKCGEKEGAGGHGFSVAIPLK